MAASYGELSESLQQRIELVMRLFRALGESVDALVVKASQEEALPATPFVADFVADADTASIFEMGNR